jgi:hypothetical protein
MKTFAEIEIQFDADPESGTIIFIFGNLVDEDTVQVNLTFTGVRTQSGEINIAEPTDTPGESSAIEFVKAFNADYNLSKLFVVERELNRVVIKSTVYEIEFDEESFSGPADVLADFVEKGLAPFAILGVTFSEHASDKCGKVTVNVLTNYQADELLFPVSINPVTTNPISFEYPRLGFNITGVSVRRGSDTVHTIINVPAGFNSQNITINVAPFGETNTVTVDMVSGGGIEFEYSMNNSTWQSSNVFTGIVGGNYTMYVRDQFGCTRQRNFTISEAGSLRSPYIHIPKSNSIRFANRITWGDSANYKNDENTLSCEVDVPLPYKEIQQFQSSDIITTQFRSNYDINDVVISGQVDPLVDQIFIPVIKKTNNMNLKDRRDAIMYPLPGNSFDPKYGIYFTQGQVYDFNTGAPLSEYGLNGNLPEWGVSGNWLRVGVNWYLIEQVIYDETKQAFVLVISPGANGVEGAIQVSCLYNRFNYEVYEFTIDFFNYLNKKIQVNIHLSDALFPPVDYLSEVIHVKVRHKNTLELRYKNKYNTDVYYGTGIEHKIRIPYERQDGVVLDESENYKTDTDTILLNAKVYEGDVFEFGPMTKEIMRQIVQAVHHSFLKVDGVDYVKESVETEGPLEETNLYMVKSTLVKARNVYSSDTGDLEFSEGALEIPGFIDSGNDNYMKYS